jgi:tungstate transport system substrate-binding protein
LLVGVEAALMASGLAPRLREAVARDTGIAIQLTAGASGDLLPRLERGDLDVAITQAPDAELSLDRQGLIHDRQLIAIGEYVLAGPAAWARPPKPAKPVKGKPVEPPPPGDPAGIRGLNDAAAALTRIAEAGARGECSFIATGEASGTRYAEAALWKAAGPKPFGPWLRTAGPGPRAALDLARETGAYVLVERGLLAAVGTGMAALVSGDARMAAEYRAMRSFRVNHPAGKLFIGWLAGPNGRAVVGRYGHYRAAPKS